jgi:hypothetical protein
VADDPLDMGLLHQLRPRARDLMDQQVGAGAILDDIAIVARIAGKHCDAARPTTHSGGCGDFL